MRVAQPIIGKLQGAVLVGETPDRGLEGGLAISSKDLCCLLGQDVDRLTTVGWSGRLVRIPVYHPGLFELMDGLPADRLSRVGRIFLPVMIPHECHDVPDAE